MESTPQKQSSAERMIVAYPLPLRPSRYRSVLHAARDVAAPKPPVNVYRLGVEAVKKQTGDRHE